MTRMTKTSVFTIFSVVAGVGFFASTNTQVETTPMSKLASEVRTAFAAVGEPVEAVTVGELIEAVTKGESIEAVSTESRPVSAAIEESISKQPTREQAQAETLLSRQDNPRDVITRVATDLPIPAVARAKMSAPVAALAESGSDELVDLIVSYETHPELFEADRVESLGGVVTRNYKSMKMRAIRIPADALASLAIDPEVRVLSMDSKISAASAAARQTARQPTAGSPNAFAVDPNIGIAILDTGVADHADLGLVNRVDIIPSASACAGTFRDEFNSSAFGGNDGSLQWQGAWVEDDTAGAGPNSGNVVISGGELRLKDQPNTGT